jgi:hypothetical protein
MKALSPLAQSVGDGSPTVGLREWLAGIRPVAGAAAASGLLLAVCSWFAHEAVGFGRSHDVGRPSPVRLQANPSQATRPARRTPTRAVHTRATVGRATTTVRRHDRAPVVGAEPTGTAPTLQPGHADTAPTAQPTHLTPTPQSAPPTTTTNLPAPVDEVPGTVTIPSTPTTVTVPPTPVTPGVTVPVPQTPSVPAPAPVVPTVTATLGLP